MTREEWDAKREELAGVGWPGIDADYLIRSTRDGLDRLMVHLYEERPEEPELEEPELEWLLDGADRGTVSVKTKDTADSGRVVAVRARSLGTETWLSPAEAREMGHVLFAAAERAQK